jgi:hypothetical protein
MQHNLRKPPDASIIIHPLLLRFINNLTKSEKHYDIIKDVLVHACRDPVWASYRFCHARIFCR